MHFAIYRVAPCAATGVIPQKPIISTEIRLHRRRRALYICASCFAAEGELPFRARPAQPAAEQRPFWSRVPVNDPIQERQGKTRRYQTARRTGLCVSCRSRQAREGAAECEACAAWHRANSRERMRELRAIAAAAGNCTSCLRGTPVDGGRLCAACLERFRLQWQRKKNAKLAKLREAQEPDADPTSYKYQVLCKLAGAQPALVSDLFPTSVPAAAGARQQTIRSSQQIKSSQQTIRFNQQDLTSSWEKTP